MRIAHGLGISADDLLGVRDWSAHDAFDARERAVLVATDEVVRDGSISAATWATCERELGPDPAVLIELVTWRMISSLLNSLEVPLEDGVESWPPDGRAPRQTIREVCTASATTLPSASVAVISVKVSSGAARCDCGTADPTAWPRRCTGWSSSRWMRGCPCRSRG